MSRFAALRILLTTLVFAAPAHAAVFSVTSSKDQGKGSLRAAIAAANSEPGSTIKIRIPATEQILVETALPAITARATVIEGGGATVRQASNCVRPGGKIGCDGLVVRAPDVVVRNLRIAGFLLDGVAVLGSEAKNVRLVRIDAIENRDDGVGVSDGAGPVLVTDCVLMGNGFRTKGKGLLVFSNANAILKNSVVVANRDGITVTRGSKATLEDVVVVGNYDKGVGASGGRLAAKRIRILANGRPSAEGKTSPNGDGVRLGLASVASLEDCQITGNGDSGVVLLDTSRADLRNCSIDGNLGPASFVARGARLQTVRRR